MRAINLKEFYDGIRVKMATETYSRSFLQGISAENMQKNKQMEINLLVNSFIHELRRHAGDGKTSYLFDMTNMHHVSPRPWNMFTRRVKYFSYTIPIEEMIPLFQDKFPDCAISYQETWVDTNSHTKALKKGILIDWS
jgi:hypothetical protein